VLPDAVAVSVDGRAAQPVTLSLYGTDGRRVARLFDGTLSPGRHVLPLHVAGRARAGHFVALLDHGRTTSRIRLIERNGRCAASSVTTHHREGAATAAVHATAGTGSNLPALDSLIIVHRAIDTHTVGIPLTDGEVAVTVDLIPRGIVELAMAEEHRCPAEVGVERRSHPGALKDYLRRTGRDDCDYEAWCSEFVSWVYKAAGMPFTGGREGGWMFTYSMAIKRWFAARGRFVARTDPAYQRFTPAPGDYIRYRNSWGGHSGIVHKVEGTTLYTIEGNIGNRVVRKTIRNYKQRADIDGFGMVSGARDIEVVVGRRAGRT
jgi:hypothetical protein